MSELVVIYVRWFTVRAHLADHGIIGTTKLSRMPFARAVSRERPERKARSPPTDEPMLTGAMAGLWY